MAEIELSDEQMRHLRSRSSWIHEMVLTLSLEASRLGEAAAIPTEKQVYEVLAGENSPDCIQRFGRSWKG